MSNGNGELQEYKILVMGSPNQEPKLVSMQDLAVPQLQRIIANGTERLYELKAEVQSLVLDLEAARMEAVRRGWISDEGHIDAAG